MWGVGGNTCEKCKFNTHGYGSFFFFTYFKPLHELKYKGILYFTPDNREMLLQNSKNNPKNTTMIKIFRVKPFTIKS